MIVGRITPSVEARITIEMMCRDGLILPVEVVMDTGFSEDLVLPSEVIHQLGLTPHGDLDMVLADGQRTTFSTWSGTALWHGQPTDVLVIESSGESLLGMNLLLGSTVTMDVRINGDVIIED